MTKALDISLTASQAAFLELDCSYPAYIGGLGSGKSYILGLRAVLNLHDSPKAVVGIYAPTHELLRQVSIPSVEFWLQEFGYVPGKDYIHNKTEHTIITKSKHLGNILFKSLSDVDTIVGYETSSAHVDELDKLDEERAEEAWQAIVSRNRLQLRDASQEKKRWSEKNQKWEYINRTCAYSSPEGFKFCYKMWGLGRNPNYQLVKGNTRDNPAISEDYITERTRGMTPEKIKAYIDGDFVNFNSGTVYHGYSRLAHDSQEEVRPRETLYMGCDFNVGKMACTIYVRRDGGREWHAVDEMHGMLDTPEMIRTILGRYDLSLHKIIMYPDSSGGGRHSSNANTSNLTLLRDAGLEVRAKPRNPGVEDRVTATNKKFTDGELFINQIKCPETARCFEQQARDKNNAPDKSSGTDHQNDASTYPIAYECHIKRSIMKVNFSFAHKSTDIWQ